MHSGENENGARCIDFMLLILAGRKKSVYRQGTGFMA
jgi:hypothetical protein